MPKEMIFKLYREACELVTSPSSSPSLRALCRQFIEQHKHKVIKECQ